jgi:threonine dehydrogenase-like Zn-dependent dehydrogenase
MRAAVFRQGRIVVGTIPDPVLAEGQVLARPRACGLRSSELHAAKFPKQFANISRRSGSPLGMRDDVDIVRGHEFVGEIISIDGGLSTGV